MMMTWIQMLHREVVMTVKNLLTCRKNCLVQTHQSDISGSTDLAAIIDVLEDDKMADPQSDTWRRHDVLPPSAMHRPPLRHQLVSWYPGQTVQQPPRFI
jgi:hypothetical protein